MLWEAPRSNEGRSSDRHILRQRRGRGDAALHRVVHDGGLVLELRLGHLHGHTGRSVIIAGQSVWLPSQVSLCGHSGRSV